MAAILAICHCFAGKTLFTPNSSPAQVFIWVGSRCSDVEVKLAYKSAQVYVQNLRIKQPDRPRQLMLTFKGKESRKFTKCFHGWSKKQVEYCFPASSDIDRSQF